MSRIFLLILLCLLIASIPLYGEIVEVSLPELNGYYGDSIITRSAHFNLARIPNEVHNVSIKLRGVADTGLLNCEGAYGQMILGPWWTNYDISMLDYTSGQLWKANFTYEDSSSVLDTTRTFWAGSGATWEFLKSGQGDLILRWYPLGIILLCSSIREPNVTIYDANLIIDGEFPVPIEKTTWGAIKSIYSILD